MNAALTRRLVEIAGPHAPSSDADLLARFASAGDPDAFAAIVRRYGPVVLAACRRVLGSSADADDAFQAAFLALARKAGSVAEPGALAAWLHRAAFRASLRALARRTRGLTAISSPEPADPADLFADVAWKDLRRVLDEELARLPEDYRGPVVLCWLDGLTRDEAAERLGYSTRTLKRRLEAGRELLRARLLRRGVSPVALAAAALDPAGLRASVPPALAAAAAKLAAPGTAPPNVAALVAAPRGRFAAGLGVALAVAAVALGAGLSPGRPPEPRPDIAPAPAPRAEVAAEQPAEAPADPLPRGALLRIGSNRFRDGGSTNQAVLSPDGKLIATGSEAGLTLFEIPSGRRALFIPAAECGVPNGYSPNNAAFAFSPDGKRLFTITGAEGGVVVAQAISVYDVATGKRLARFAPPKNAQPNRGFDRGYTHLWFPAGGKHLVAVRDGTVFIDPNTGVEVARTDSTAMAAESTPDGVRLFSVSPDGLAIHVDDADGRAVRDLEHGGKPVVLGFSPDGAFAAAATEQSDIRVWDVATGKKVADVSVADPPRRGRGMAVTVLALAPGGKVLFAGTQEGAIYRFDLGTGKEPRKLTGHTSYVNALFVTDGGKTLVSAGWSHRVLRHDLATNERLPDPPGYTGYLHVDRSPDGKLIAAADDAGVVELLDAKTGRRVGEVQKAGGPPATAVAFSPDGKLLAGGHRDGTVRLWEVPGGKPAREFPCGPAPKDPGNAWFEGLRFSPDGKTIAASGRACGSVAFDVATGRRLWDDAKRVGRLAFTPDGGTIVSGGWDNTIHVADAATGHVRASAPSVRRVVDDIAVSPDGRLLATGHHDGHVCLRNPETGTVVREWPAHGRGKVAWGVSFGPGGVWLASAGDETVAVWDVPTGTLLRRFEGHASRAYSAKFSADGRTVLSSSMDLTGYVWDVKPDLGPNDARGPAELWDDLGGEPAAAFRAVWLAAAEPKMPALLKEKVPPATRPGADPEKVARLVADLDSDDFKTREAAEKALAAMGPAAAPAARKALAATESAEVRQRLTRLLRKWEPGPPTPEDWRRKRAVLAMGLAGTPEAREVLRAWAGGDPDVILTADAKAALARLDGR